MKTNGINEMVDVIVAGVVVLDLTASPVDKAVFDNDNTEMDEIVLATGGDAANQAVQLAKLGRSVSLSCRVGANTLGSLFISQVSAHGVDTSRISVTQESIMGVTIVLVSADGQRSFLCKRGNNRDYCRADIDFSRIAQARALSVASLFALPGLEKDGLLDMLRIAKDNGLITFADTMVRRADAKLDDIRAFLPYIDYFLPSEAECTKLTGRAGRDAAQVFLDAGAGNVVIKMGSQGAYAHCTDFSGQVPAFDIEPKDTTGSGDAFCAGFVHSKLAGAATYEAVEYACACGSYNAMYMGAANSPISEETINTFIAEQKAKEVKNGTTAGNRSIGF